MSDQVNYEADNYNADETRTNIRDNDNSNWWPLLLIPLAFFIGWGVNEARDTANNQAYQNTAQSGVGGAPGFPCNDKTIDE